LGLKDKKMSGTPSLFAGIGAQLLDNNGDPLSGGKLFTYIANTTTPIAVYTSQAATTAHPNPIILDSAGKVPTGEIWLKQGVAEYYKFIVRTSTDVLLNTYDFVPGTYAGLDLSGPNGSSLVGFIQAGTGAVATTVQTKLRETVSVKDFGAVGDGVANDTVAINLALNSGAKTVVMPKGEYLVSSSIIVPSNTWLKGDGVSAVTIKPFASTYAFVFIQNYEASQALGSTLDENIRISDLTIDGLSVVKQPVDDSKRGMGIELYAAKNVYIHDIKIINMPLSGIEIVGGKAASMRGGYPPPYGNSTPLLKCIDIIIQRIEFNHVGWQEENLTVNPAFIFNNPAFSNDLRFWTDAGFGVIARAPARNVKIIDVVGKNVWYGVAGVGQSLNLNNSAQTGDNLAQVIGATIERCFSDQTGYTVGAPAFRAAFCRNVVFDDLTAVGSAGTAGISLRQAGTTWVQNVTVSNSTAYGCAFGLLVNGKTDVSDARIENVSISNGEFYENTTDGVLIQDSSATLSNVFSHNNTVNGFRLFPFTGTFQENTTLVNCVAKNNGAYGIQLRDCLNCVVAGCLSFDDQTVPTQTNGIRETDTSNFNIITNSVSYNNTSNQILAIGNNTVEANNIGVSSSPVSSQTIVSGVITVPATNRFKMVFVDTEGAVASDDLDTINGGADKLSFVFRNANNARSVVFKDGVGNLRLAGDCTLASTNDTISLIKDGTQWKELSRSING